MKQAKKPIVATIVLTWNSADFIDKCLESLLKSDYQTEVLVVDNDSSDGTRAIIAKNFPSITVVNSGSNLGYAGGNNFGLKYLEDTSYDYLFVLNPDAGVEVDTITHLVNRMEAELKVAAVSPIIYFHGGKRIWYAGSTINWKSGNTPHIGWNEEDSGQYNAAKYTERLNGCAMLLRKAVIEKTGLFDENYFLYYEEADLSVRLSRAGYKLGLAPDAHVWHKVSSSTGGHGGKTYQYYMTRNKLYFMNKFIPNKRWVFFLRSVLSGSFELLVILKKDGFKAAFVVGKVRFYAHTDYVRSNFGRRVTL